MDLMSSCQSGFSMDGQIRCFRKHRELVPIATQDHDYSTLNNGAAALTSSPPMTT
jgi:hypothetical protein